LFNLQGAILDCQRFGHEKIRSTAKTDHEGGWWVEFYHATEDEDAAPLKDGFFVVAARQSSDKLRPEKSFSQSNSFVEASAPITSSVVHSGRTGSRRLPLRYRRF
jgi:hypothetical protein